MERSPADLDRDPDPFEEWREWMSDVVAGEIDDVEVEDLISSDSATGLAIFRVRVWRRGRVSWFVAKRLSGTSDWIARATGDHSVRERALFESGLPGLLPECVVWPAVAVRKITGAWELLMRDVADFEGAALIPSGDDPVAEEEVTTYLQHLAEIHRTLAGRRSSLADVEFCRVEDWLTMLGPATIKREAGASDPVTPHLRPGWSAFDRFAPALVRDSIHSLLENPTPLIARLERGDLTLVHGDFKFGNLGRQAGAPPKTIALDWSQAMWTSPLLDLGWFLAVNSARLPFAKETAIEIYRQAAGRAPGPNWDEQIDVALLSGGLLRLGWAKALGAASDDPKLATREGEELTWWLAAAERALRRL